MTTANEATLLFLIFSANSAPILATHLLSGRFDRAIDGGRRWQDGRPLLGASKTWRGLISGVALPTMLAPLLGWPPQHGTLIGASAMLGDLCSSFVKRRLALPPEARATGLDQLPEALIPTLIATTFLSINGWELIVIPVTFMLIEISISPLLYRLHLRNKPY